MAFRTIFPRIRTVFRSANRSFSTRCEPLKDRSVLKVKRDSCEEFLQGLITNDINLLSSQKCIYTLMLNPKGRVLFDMFMHRTDDADVVNIECSSEVVEPIVKLLRLHSLRKKVDLVVSDLSVWAVFEENGSKTDYVADPRLAKPWVYRHLATRQPSDDIVEGHYKQMRFTLGIAEGPKEIPSGEAFPLEYNADILNGVSFDKGCYVGQELTARVHHTGVIRKRVMPLELSEPADGANLADEPVKDLESGKTVGKIRNFFGNRALALMRVNETIASKGLMWGRHKVKAAIPSWWPPLAKESDVVKRQA